MNFIQLNSVLRKKINFNLENLLGKNPSCYRHFNNVRQVDSKKIENNLPRSIHIFIEKNMQTEFFLIKLVISNSFTHKKNANLDHNKESQPKGPQAKTGQATVTVRMLN